MADKLEIIRNTLLQHAKKISSNYEWPWLDETPLSMRNANKFILGAIINYQIGANLAWKNARRLAEEILGDPPRLWNHIVDSYAQKEEWASKKNEFNLHRFPAAHNRIWRMGSDIVRIYDGDSRRIWQGKTPGDALTALERLRCGPDISRMIVGALITCNHLTGRGDVKADRHVQRVLGRVFACELEPESARQMACKIHPNNPWELDLALYDIGKKYCLPSWLYCEDCPVSSECQTAIHWEPNSDRDKGAPTGQTQISSSSGARRVFGITTEQQNRGRLGEEEIKRRLQLPGGWGGFSLIDDKRNEDCGYDFLCAIDGRQVMLEVKTFTIDGHVPISSTELRAAAAGQNDYYLLGVLDDGKPENEWRTSLLPNPISTLMSRGEFDIEARLHAPASNIFPIRDDNG